MVALTLNVICALVGGEVPLTAVQLLWVNVIMDTMGALALATEPPRQSLMDRKPYGRDEAIITNVIWRNLLVMSAFQLAVLMALYFGGCSLLGFPDSQLTPDNCAGYPTVLLGNTSVCYDRARGCPPVADVDGRRFTQKTLLAFSDRVTLTTVIFNAFVFMQIFNEVNVRNMEQLNVFRGLAVNRLFVAIVLAEAGLQYVIVTFAGVFAQTVPLSWQHWVVSLVAAACAFPVALLAKLVPVPETPSLPSLLLPRRWLRVARRSSGLTAGGGGGSDDEEGAPLHGGHAPHAPSPASAGAGGGGGGGVGTALRSPSGSVQHARSTDAGLSAVREDRSVRESGAGSRGGGASPPLPAALQGAGGSGGDAAALLAGGPPDRVRARRSTLDVEAAEHGLRLDASLAPLPP